jgi:hypothetical protein
MSREIELWRAVADDASLIEQAAAVDPTDVTAITKLRRDYPADVVSVALSLVAARCKAAAKFGDLSARLIADVAGVEQASSAAVAAYKAERIAKQLGEQAAIADLCCGIGGDSMALSSAGLSVIAVDRDPLRVWMAGRNSTQRTQGVCADVAQLELDGLPIHLDPARRNEQSGKRSWRLADYQPGPEVIGALIDRSPSAAIKLSPGIDLEALPWPGEVEFISDRGRLVQAMLWSGGFAEHDRQATLINGADRHHLRGTPTMPSYAPAQRYVYTFDPAVERADLIGQLSSQLEAPVVHPRLGLLTSERLIESPWVVGFELIERMPWRPKRVKQWLSANDGGLVEVKTRGKSCDPDKEQQRLRDKGTTPYTVFVLRFDTKVQALITRRI